jgi:hypothetical protein
VLNLRCRVDPTCRRDVGIRTAPPAHLFERQAITVAEEMTPTVVATALRR